MFVKPLILSICCLLFLANGCDSNPGNSQSPNQPGATQTATASPSNAAAPTVSANSNPAVSPAIIPGALNACTVIENSEIAAVQGAQVQSTLPNNQRNGGIITSQCYYSVVSADGSRNLSVHLQIMKADPSDPKAVNEYWEKAFHEKGDRGEGEEKEASPPQRIAGLGEEAFWIASPKSGVLYAFQKKSLIRLSVGGSADQKTRLEKSKKLMAKVLERAS